MHDLRRTCGTFLTYGGASAFLSAKRLGHSVTVSEKYYAGALSNLPKDASTLEAAMGCADLFKKTADLAAVSTREPAEAGAAAS